MSIGDGNDAEGNGAGGDAPLHQTKKQRTIADGGPINHEWTPPEKVEELFAKAGGNRFASINQPTSGARAEVPLPDTDRPVQLYSLGTPNGIKVGILLEELGVDYDAHKINIMKCEQFNSGFVNVNPNGKIPAAIDKDGPGGEPIHLFESAAIMTYFADKMDRFNFSANARARQEMMQWITFQMANQGPTTGNFGHFFVYAPEDKCETREYGVARYGMEVQRICDVMDKHLEGRAYFVNEEYSVADMALFPWFDQLRKGYVHKSGIAAATFLSVDKYKNLNRWADELLGREAVQRGITPLMSLLPMRLIADPIMELPCSKSIRAIKCAVSAADGDRDVIDPIDGRLILDIKAVRGEMDLFVSVWDGKANVEQIRKARDRLKGREN